MKKSIVLLVSILSLSFVSISCSSEDENSNESTNQTELNTDSLEKVRQQILSGFWQLDTYKEIEDTQFNDAEYYQTYKFYENDLYDVYYNKETKYATWEYRLTSLDNKTVFIKYSTKEDYDNNKIDAINVYDASIENGRFKLVNRESKKIEFYKKYNSINETKDLSGGL